MAVRSPASTSCQGGSLPSAATRIRPLVDPVHSRHGWTRASGGASPRSFGVPAEPLTAIFTNRRTLAFVLVWFAVNLLFGLTGGVIAGVDGPIAWEAHIGGFLAGLLLFPLLDPVGRDAGPEEGAGKMAPDS